MEEAIADPLKAGLSQELLEYQDLMRQSQELLALSQELLGQSQELLGQS